MLLLSPSSLFEPLVSLALLSHHFHDWTYNHYRFSHLASDPRPQNQLADPLPLRSQESKQFQKQLPVQMLLVLFPQPCDDGCCRPQLLNMGLL